MIHFDGVFDIAVMTQFVGFHYIEMSNMKFMITNLECEILSLKKELHVSCECVCLVASLAR